jgi:hypothetical protein
LRGTNKVIRDTVSLTGMPRAPKYSTAIHTRLLPKDFDKFTELRIKKGTTAGDLARELISKALKNEVI